MRFISARTTAAAAFGAALAVSSSASFGQLVFGTTTTTTTNPAAIYLDVTTGQTTTLWNSAANKKVNGLAADPTGKKLYANDAARLNVWNYGQVGTVPVQIAGMYRSDGTTTSATGFSGLAWANGKLYGSTSFASSTFTRGIYQIPLVPDANNRLITTQVWAEPVNSGILTLEGLDFDPSSNLFYAAQDTDGTGNGVTLTRGLYTIDVFGNGAMTKVTDFPAGFNSVDGVAVGGGKVWLTQFVSASSQVNIFPYNLSTNAYDATITFALTDGTSRASGATWAPGALGVPEPTTLAALAGAAAVLKRRRR